jgi:ATP dependent DNA ligase domain
LCALNADGVPVFSRLQAAMDEGRTDQLVFYAFDLLFLNGKSTAQLPLVERKASLQGLFKKEILGLRYSEHVAGNGPQFRAQACKLGLEGTISKRADRPYAPGDRGDLGQVEVPQPRRVRCSRLERPRGQPRLHRRPAAGLLHRRRQVALRRPRRQAQK